MPPNINQDVIDRLLRQASRGTALAKIPPPSVPPGSSAMTRIKPITPRPGAQWSRVAKQGLKKLPKGHLLAALAGLGTGIWSGDKLSDLVKDYDIGDVIGALDPTGLFAPSELGSLEQPGWKQQYEQPGQDTEPTIPVNAPKLGVEKVPLLDLTAASQESAEDEALANLLQQMELSGDLGD